ncbi:PepSY domain-containing protein [Streptomyces gardneri]|uniref:PepSY domain-containing protein n=1 Tax=Nocardia TaxID=1817 RepID=UPI00135AB8FF|nr:MULTISPECIES: PepSY domain-containing protein [Nocardia]MBF6165839.1 PepSY domain-containing protein [Streptomyces gardneri]MBF6203162.1 PepSY domain-containing protein [Streptomyces gardneri]UAK30013.1 PepSY domain-containing protein [Nocardia asteroides]
MTTVLRRAYAGLRWLMVGTAVAAAVVGLSAVLAAVATGGPDDHTVSFQSSAADWSLVADTGISRQQAIDKAVQAVPGGRVVSAELDTDRGKPVWEVELTTPQGVEHDVTIDAGSGEVLADVDHD